MEHHAEALQAPGMQTQPAGQQALVEGVEAAVVLGDGLDRSQFVRVKDLSAP